MVETDNQLPQLHQCGDAVFTDGNNAIAPERTNSAPDA